MTLRMTPIASVSAKKGIVEFKIRSKEKWVLQDLRQKIRRWCERQDIELEEGW